MDQKEQDRLTQVEIGVARLDTQTAVLSTKVDTIANNHLKHLQDDVTSVKKTLWWTFSTLVGCLISLVFVLVQTLI
tara:strand:- start:1591 stop:1818 length:228 start_codon:yes stop_codon:yes gene_type:complete